MNRRSFIAAFSALALPWPGRAADDGANDAPKAVVTEMVEAAVAAIDQHGLANALRQTPRATWLRAETGLYVFVFDGNGVLRMHPEMRMVGQQIRGTLDAEGTAFIERILGRLKNAGNAMWSEYLWFDPSTGRVRRKRVYSKRAGRLIVNCGYYAERA